MTDPRLTLTPREALEMILTFDPTKHPLIADIQQIASAALAADVDAPAEAPR